MKDIPKKDQGTPDEPDASDVSGGISPTDGCFPQPIQPSFPDDEGYTDPFQQPGLPNPLQAFTGA